MLFLCGRLGLDGGRSQAVQFTGEAIGQLPMQERMTLANMTAEIGGQTGLIAPDDITADFIRNAGADPGERPAGAAMPTPRPPSITASTLRPWSRRSPRRTAPPMRRR